MATSVDKYYATEEEKRPISAGNNPFGEVEGPGPGSGGYERISTSNKPSQNNVKPNKPSYNNPFGEIEAPPHPVPVSGGYGGDYGGGYERISSNKPSESDEQPFLDSQTLRSPTTKYIILGYTIIVTFMVLITVVLSIVRGYNIGAAYLLLGISLLCIAFVELLLIFLIKKDELPREKLWFVFFVGFGIFIESVLTNVLLYH